MKTSNINQTNNLNPAKLEKLKKVCKEFESEILNFYLKEALNSNSKLFPKSPGEEIYKSMYQEELSKELSGNFGYSELLYNYLKNKV